METDTQGVTVIVPTLNRGGFLLDCLKDLLAQEHSPLEILVVDQSPVVDERVRDLAEEHKDVISYQRVDLRGLPQARNYGWRNARFDAMLYVDDDIRCGPGLVAEHLRALRLPNVGLVGGGIDEAHKPLDAGPPTGYFRRWTATPVRGFAAVDEHFADHAPGGNFSVWRTAIQQVGGVDGEFSRGAGLYEETDLCLRVKQAGYRIYFNGNARLTHLAAPGGGCRVENVGDYVWGLARNRAMLIRRHLRWYHWPTALARLLLLTARYAVYYREPSVFPRAHGGFTDGWGILPPLEREHWSKEQGL